MNRSALIKFIFVPLTSLVLWACGGGEARRLPDSGFAVEFLENTIPNKMSAGQDSSGDVVIRNISKNTWPSRANAKNRNHVNLSYRWKDLKGRIIVADERRTALPHDLAPGESVRLKIDIAAPARPGRYNINVTLVQEGVAWFDEKGGAALSLPVVVAPSALSTTKEAGQDSSAASGAGAMKSAKANVPKPVDELPDGDKKSATKPAKSTLGRGPQGES